MRGVVVASLCLALTACATAPQAPVARPLPQAAIDKMGPTPISVTGSELGVGKAWFYTEINGGGAGLIGAVAGAIASAIINAGPSARANKQANEVAEVLPVERLNASFVDRVKQEAAKSAGGTGVTVSDAFLTYKSIKPEALDDTVEITTTYTLSEDSSVIRIISLATYSNKELPYRTPYTFKGSPPKSETTGPLYRNTFTYYSTPLPVPTLTPELRERLIANIREAARDDAGAAPAEGSKEYKAMMREIDQANDDKLTPHEISLFLTREWLSKDGARIKEEVARAHDFTVRYVVLDLNRTAVPSMTGQDELLETAPDGRTVRRIGAGVAAGSYEASAPNVTTFATYGNTLAISKQTVAYMKSLKDKAAKTTGTK